MRLPPGSRLGRYEIVAHVGSGGMGDVYRARDTHLDHQVALKTIAATYAEEPGSQPRFERERRLMAALEHPHICRLLDAGREGDVDYLAMEFLDGESLAHRLTRGPLPVAAAIGYAIEIADALQFAHRQGIIHRDLTPANVFLTRTGAKVLDFGLAKRWREETGARSPARPGDTVPLEATRAGAIVGSAPYLAPERLEGHDADHRTDLFSFGAVLYEMLAGRRAFEGNAPLAAILSREPPPMGLEHPAAADLEWVLRKCLAKNPDDRWQSMADVHVVLRRLAGSGLAASAPVPRRRGMLVAAALAALLAVAATLAWTASRRTQGGKEAQQAWTILPPQGGAFTPTAEIPDTAQLAIAPDGLSLAFVAAGADGIPRVWVRTFESLLSRPIAGTEGAMFPFWSPDSRAIGFFAREMLHRVDVAGGSPQTIAAARSGRGGTWNDDGDILFVPDNTGTVRRVSTARGDVTEVTRLDQARGETSHRWPQFLPDGRRFLYFVRTTADFEGHEGIYLGSLNGAPPRLVARTSASAAFLPPNRILFLDGTTLLARAIDLSDGTPTGDPVVVAERVGSSASFYGAVSASQTGVIAYATGGTTSDLVWRARDEGRPMGPPVASGVQVDFRLSPDDGAVAIAELDRETGSTNVSVIDFTRGERRRVTSARGNDASPVWSPDGERIVFRSNREGRMHDLYSANIRGADAQGLIQIQTSNTGKYPTSWSRHGIAFHTGQPDTRWDVLIADPRPGGAVRPFLNTRFEEIQAQFSRDGKWVAYTSNELGKPDVWVSPWGRPRAARQVSLNGGSDPRWRADGAELFYISGAGQLTAVAVRQRGESVELGRTEELFPIGDAVREAPFASRYDVSLDGKRFLVRELRESVGSTPLNVVLNWRPDATR
jgi:eukaryotic-like serine/threonine-protein kinase